MLVFCVRQGGGRARFGAQLTPTVQKLGWIEKFTVRPNGAMPSVRHVTSLLSFCVHVTQSNRASLEKPERHNSSHPGWLEGCVNQLADFSIPWCSGYAWQCLSLFEDHPLHPRSQDVPTSDTLCSTCLGCTLLAWKSKGPFSLKQLLLPSDAFLLILFPRTVVQRACPLLDYKVFLIYFFFLSVADVCCKKATPGTGNGCSQLPQGSPKAVWDTDTILLHKWMDSWVDKPKSWHANWIKQRAKSIHCLAITTEVTLIFKAVWKPVLKHIHHFFQWQLGCFFKKHQLYTPLPPHVCPPYPIFFSSRLHHVSHLSNALVPPINNFYSDLLIWLPFSFHSIHPPPFHFAVASSDFCSWDCQCATTEWRSSLLKIICFLCLFKIQHMVLMDASGKSGRFVMELSNKVRAEVQFKLITYTQVVCPGSFFCFPTAS